jgi:uncharacterized protein with HEPN domain
MTAELFGQAWPAYFARLEKMSPGVPTIVRYTPLKPSPAPVGLLFASGGAPDRPAAVVLRDPWEIYPLDDPAFGPYLDELQGTITAFSDELINWSESRRSGYGSIIPASMEAAGANQMAAMRRLVKPILQKTHRKLSAFGSVLLPHQYELLHGELFLYELLTAGTRIAATVGRGRAVFDSDLDAQDATLRRLEVIGECKKVLEQGGSVVWHAVAEAPWDDAAGMRELIAHAFVGIDIDLVWRTASEDIPKLMTALQAPQPGAKP